MKLVRITVFSFLLLPVVAHSAWNWSGSLKTKIQADNRYKRYVDEADIFGELWGSFEAFDNKSLNVVLDFVTRESLEAGLEGDIFQFYIEKDLKAFQSKVKAGRFQRADSLGFYSLDGASVQYQMPKKGLTVEVYGGRPIRQEDMHSVSADWVYGAELNSLQKVHWNNQFLPVDLWAVRFGFQQLHNEHSSTRLSLANVLGGQFKHQYLHAYELSFMTTVEVESGAFEEIFTGLLLDITKYSRVQINYARYEPKSFYPTFKEKFYTSYYAGKQDLLSLSFNQSITPTLDYHLAGKRAARNVNQDIGYGFDMGIKSRHFSDWRLSTDFDMLEFGESSSYNLYFGSEYSLSSNALLNLNLAYSLDKSALYAENKAAGTELKLRYKIIKNLFMDLAGSYIVNSRLKDEYLGAVQMTWYFDNFMTKDTK